MRVLRANTSGGRINKLENRSIGITVFVTGKKKFKNKKNEESQSVIHHQLNQHVYNRIPRGRKENMSEKNI